MKCNYCDKPATIFLTQFINKKLKKICLCESCSTNKDIIEKEELTEILQQSPIEPSLSEGLPEPLSELTCHCGFTVNDLTQTGRLGCPACYEVFGSILEDRISSMHRGDKHSGKEIAIPLDLTSLMKKKKKLSDALDSAINNEEFEKAAQLRDEMNSLITKIAEL